MTTFVSNQGRKYVDLKRLSELNEKALDARSNAGANLASVTIHNAKFHEMRRDFPYSGFIDISINQSNFVMFSNNDDTVAQSYFWFGADGFEPLSLSTFAALSKQASVVFDIGAFTGVYSLCAQHQNPNAKVVAFEPSRSTWERSKVNFVANRMGTKIDLHDFALSSSEGQVEFNHYRGSLALQSGASLVKKGDKEVYSTEVVNTRLGDDVVKQYGGVDLIKIDVEGAELMVLEGLKQSFVNNQPTVIIEIEPHNISDILMMFADLSYEVRTIDDLNGQFLTPDPAEKVVINYLAWSKDKTESVEKALGRKL